MTTTTYTLTLACSAVSFSETIVDFTIDDTHATAMEQLFPAFLNAVAAKLTDNKYLSMLESVINRLS